MFGTKSKPLKSSPTAPSAHTWRPWSLHRRTIKPYLYFTIFGTIYKPLGSSPAAPSAHTWRPWSLHPRFFLCFAFLCALLIVALEFIVRGCENGCPVFGLLSGTKFSRRTQFAYHQFPTVVSLALSLLWAVPNHNILRLEPYFRMSVDGGTTAVDSIFLNYPYIFPLLVPYRAARLR